eukprot:jgi/Astpho2/8323/Aster-x1513
MALRVRRAHVEADQAPMYAKEGSNVQWKLVDPLEMVDIMGAVKTSEQDMEVQLPNFVPQPAHLDVFGQSFASPPGCHITCMYCGSSVFSSRFAAHLAKCPEQQDQGGSRRRARGTRKSYAED